MNSDLVGSSINDLPTPALLVDYNNLQKNLQTMQRLVAGAGCALRPHIKTHKCSELAKMQIEAGAIGVTCATIGEAEAMASAGIKDILIANQLVTADKLQRVARLTLTSDIKFVVDSLEGIRAAEQAAETHHCIFEVLVEVDIGGGRCGARSPLEAVTLVQAVLHSAHLHFGGIQAYYGGISYIEDLEARHQASQRSDLLLQGFLAAVKVHSPIPRVSGAGTGHAANFLQFSNLTEYQSGTYVYSDTTYQKLSPEYLPALSVLSTVISHPSPAMLVMDAGLKALGTEFSTPVIAAYPDLKMDRYSEEHVQWLSATDDVPSIGEKVQITPSHCCTTVNHHRRCFLIDAGHVRAVWVVDAF